jgi:hypothetical protein
MKTYKGLGAGISRGMFLLSFILSLCHGAMGAVSFQFTQWVEPDAPAVQTSLSNVTFNQYGSGAYSSVYSESFYNYVANPRLNPLPTGWSTVTGPGIIGIGADAGFGSAQSALFTGFGDNGGQGVISIETQLRLAGPTYFDGLSFDVYSGELAGGLHGPTSFYVQVGTNQFNYTPLWQSELVTLVPGEANAIHWDISNPDGNDANGDGVVVNGGLLNTAPPSDWRSLYYDSSTTSAILEVRIVASGANSSLTGLGMDNIQFMGVSTAVVPEPSSCLLLVLGLFVVGRRFRGGRAGA